MDVVAEIEERMVARQRAESMMAENKLLREFYNAWVFFHATKNDPGESEAWNQTRQKMAAQSLLDSSKKVDAHLKKMRLN